MLQIFTSEVDFSQEMQVSFKIWCFWKVFLITKLKEYNFYSELCSLAKDFKTSDFTSHLKKLSKGT